MINIKSFYFFIIIKVINLKGLTDASLVENCPTKICSCNISKYEDYITNLQFLCQQNTNLSNISLEGINGISIEGNFTSLPDIIVTVTASCFSVDLDVLVIRRTLIMNLQQHKLTCLKNLKELRIFDNVINEITQDFLSPLDKLSRLHLSNNKITKIHKNAFLKLSNLAKLDLSKNMITTISNDTFFPYSITQIDLSSNKIQRKF